MTQTTIWTAEKANAWYGQQPFLKGANFLPAYAINQLEMWQAETFDPARIDLELSWAQDLGMNTMRVFLHDLLWEQDSAGFLQRIETFLGLCDARGIKPMMVFFDSWDPFPALGPQRAPQPGIHNSGWVQSPGAHALLDPSQYARLERYVKGVVSAFAQDPRVLIWDVWNEPCNRNLMSYGEQHLKLEPADKLAHVEALLPQVFEWVRSAQPQQPLTSGLWCGKWDDHDQLEPIHKIQIENSDILSFHNYEAPAVFEGRVRSLQKYGRPILCTEYMARNMENRFDNIVPLAKSLNVGLYNWGFVAGKSQTNIPWDSWQNPYTGERKVNLWFHDIFHEDGTPYDDKDIEVLKAA